jgi:tRNA-binding EMAP/Myf-like protein
MEAFCRSCDSVQEVESVEEGSKLVFCIACGEEFDPSCSGSAVSGSSIFSNYSVGRVLVVEGIPKQKDLKKVLVDVVGDSNIETAVQIVTNAKYVESGWVVVVALENAIVPAGSTLEDDPNAVQVKPRAVGGVMSRGMLCDSPMLGWTGGAKGIIQQLPVSCAVGSTPPSTRPRS